MALVEALVTELASATGWESALDSALVSESEWESSWPSALDSTLVPGSAAALARPAALGPIDCFFHRDSEPRRRTRRQ